MIAGFDTNILSYLLRSPTDAELARRSHRLLDEVMPQTDEILVPCPVLAELLVHYPADGRRKMLMTLDRRFRVRLIPFDRDAALIAAELKSLHLSRSRKRPASPRQVVSADILILAAAKAAGVTAFYTHDASCRRLADLIDLPAFDLPA